MSITNITLSLENCFGIKKLEHTFDFTGGDTIAIYAPNAVMKTSLAKTFSCIQAGGKKLDEIKDHIFNSQPIKHEVQIDGTQITKDKVFVIKSFETQYQSDNLAHLLLNDDYKSKLKDVIQKRNELLAYLQQQSGLKNAETTEYHIINDFNGDDRSFLELLSSLIDDEAILDFAELPYCVINDMKDKILSADFQDNITTYQQESQKIFEDSNFAYLSKGKFTFTSLKKVQKSLEEESFFTNSNKLLLAGKEVDEQALKSEIQSIASKLNQSSGLKKLESMLSSSEKGKILQLCIENNPDLIPFLTATEFPSLLMTLWSGYINKPQIKDDFQQLERLYIEAKKAIDEKNIDNMPRKQALDIFNKRFIVPFNMDIVNKTSVMLGTNTIPQVVFKFYKDGNKDNDLASNVATIDRKDLESKDTLSQGEKRALYLLNIIFDIEKMKRDGTEKLLIIDDIADSFDYKNKYAIVEYLREIQEYRNSSGGSVFYQVILTHNFDFYRTISSRLNLCRNNKLHATKTNSSLVLKGEVYQSNPFETRKETMKPCNYYSNTYLIEDAKKHIIALIPFIRNLIQYGDNHAESAILLTHLLHKKNRLEYNELGKPVVKYPTSQVSFIVDKTEDIGFIALKPIYLKYLGKNDFDASIDSLNVLDEIYRIANTITSGNTNLEDKIVLAIAIRLKAEEYMITTINNLGDIDKIEGNQTWSLYKMHTRSADSMKVLNSVNIMTPENIHLNSFMYEPILDMGIDELINLYQHVSSLS